jgi:competence protein ComEA
MDPLAPQWRTLGAPPESAPGADPARVPTRPRPALPLLIGVVLVVAGVMTAIAAGILALAPDPRSLLVVAAADVTDGTVDMPPTGVVQAITAGNPGSPLLVVDVGGAVARPGLVRVPAGGRVGDAIRLAGGFAPRADLEAASSTLNLAQPLVDGMKVLVPGLGDGRAAAPPEGSGQTAGRVDLNRATLAELEELPGIGPVTAARIVEAREQQQFRTVDELRGRDVLGQSTFDKIRELVTVGG